MNDQPTTPNVDQLMALAFPPDYVQPGPLTTAQQLSPDQVNAIVRDMDDPRYPAQIGVFCDDCNLTFKGDFIVTDDMDSEARFEVARTHLRTVGWSCTADGDLCPKCATEAGA